MAQLVLPVEYNPEDKVGRDRDELEIAASVLEELTINVYVDELNEPDLDSWPKPLAGERARGSLERFKDALKRPVARAQLRGTTDYGWVAVVELPAEDLQNISALANLLTTSTNSDVQELVSSTNCDFGTSDRTIDVADMARRLSAVLHQSTWPGVSTVADAIVHAEDKALVISGNVEMAYRSVAAHAAAAWAPGDALAHYQLLGSPATPNNPLILP